MRILNPKGIVRQAKQAGTAPAEAGRGTLQNGLRKGNAGGNFVLSLAFECWGRDLEEELKLLSRHSGSGSVCTRRRPRPVPSVWCGARSR